MPDIDQLQLVKQLPDDEDDPAAYKLPPTPSQLLEQDDHGQERRYDIYITYDKYYQTPRLWLQGYQGNTNRLLRPEQIFEDVSHEHARKTVTVEQFPHLHMVHMVCVHPCRHAAVMKRLCGMFNQGATDMLPVEQYLLVFLKFMGAILPTIEYDNTAAVRV